MANIHTGALPKINDKVKEILIQEGGFLIIFESGARTYTHAYTDERQYVSSRPNDKTESN